MPRLVWKRASNTFSLWRYSDRIDAILASYPKSGRTWFRYILSSYIARLYKLEPAPDLHTMFRVLPNFDLDPVRGLPAFAFADHKPKPPLIAVSHLRYARRWFRSYPTVFMVRDPKDVLVSAYFHATRQKHRFSGDIDAFLVDPKQGISSLTEYLNGWAAGLSDRPHIVISYEKLSSDPVTETAKVLAFLGLEENPDMLNAAIETASFKRMLNLELKSGLPGHEYDRSDSENLRMRRGKVGGFGDYLTEAQIALIDDTCARNLTPEAKALLSRAVA
ncbi:sulfotransferase domain-containing protein [Paracoccus aurantiacus]|uniref:Sulfotransferase domain-containing protein n=1 Tax=Paracoccus aurantiacus TaxID=2599412 RepID=A0A5C6S1Z5_9RHOB|nr:sulfotransferase domain-containing protein [Paracoccus aurantiacus]TXB68619.1 sulfotransferase domain-containing protein [Paracoccus aurantiacus]